MSTKLPYKLVTYRTLRGYYRAVTKERRNGTFDLVMIDSYPVSVQKKLPVKEKQYCDEREEGKLGTTCKQMLQVGGYRGITKEAIKFLELAQQQDEQRSGLKVTKHGK